MSVKMVDIAWGLFKMSGTFLSEHNLRAASPAQ